MSIASELSRLQTAKNDLATSIANKGVTVPAATTLDGYAALVDSIQTGGGTLPYDAEVEYLETTGIQYIDTGIAQTSRNFEYTLKIQWTGSTNSQFETFFGYMIDGAIIPRSGFHKYTGKWMFGTNTTRQTNVNVDSSTHTICVKGDASAQKEMLYIDGSLIDTATTTSNGISQNLITFFLGTRNRNGSIDNPCSAKFFSLRYRVYSNSTHSVILEEWDFIPVRIGQVGYLYDRISGQLFGNVGTGSFTLGPDVT